MQWRSRTRLVSVFRSLSCQFRSICRRLTSLISMMRLSKSHLTGLTPGKKLESELHAFLARQSWFVYSLSATTSDRGWWSGFFFVFYSGGRNVRMICDDRWIDDPWWLRSSVVWPVAISRPSTLPVSPTMLECLLNFFFLELDEIHFSSVRIRT